MTMNDQMSTKGSEGRRSEAIQHFFVLPDHRIKVSLWLDDTLDHKEPFSLELRDLGGTEHDSPTLVDRATQSNQCRPLLDSARWASH